MYGMETDRWNTARLELIERWRRILQRIDARDEGGVLVLANVQDEFCEQAIEAREGAGGAVEPAAPLLKLPLAGTLAGTRCLFCRGFAATGGCLGLLNELNQAVLARRWEVARRLAEGYIERLQTIDLEELAGPHVH